jgi:asparagine synthase (glutamine-hydrolysing)
LDDEPGPIRDSLDTLSTDIWQHLSMCGLAGFVELKGACRDAARVAQAMAGALAHRGPDHAGVWVDEALGVALAHRRLSIVDLSPAGHQPMASASGRHVLVFNGEIYNHRDMRAALAHAGQAPDWRGGSDTEVLLAAIAAWGVKAALEAAVGMFALAVLDRERGTLTLARDRVGEKPLYYGWAERTFLFGSELKALKRHPAWRGEIDREAAALFMRLSAVPAPRTIYRGISKLLPGSLLEVDLTSGQESTETYWDTRHVAEAGLADPFAGSADDAAREVEALLKQAIAGQMVADVPLGAFLSGGIDSSTVVALMQALSPKPVKTFTIGFRSEGYDEAKDARAVARHLGTDHTELYVTERDARDVIPHLPEIYCEPFADPSQIPTYLVSRLAREHVTVSLSGDGGDELFSGYSRYAFARSYWPRLAQVPAPMRRAAAGLVGRASPAAWDAALRLPLSLLPRSRRPQRAGEQLLKAALVAAAGDGAELYNALVSRWPMAEAPVMGEASLPLDKADGLGGLVRTMMYADLTGYLPDDVLAKLDRAGMAVSLETRVPMLDHRLVAFSWRLPDAILSRDGRSKWPLRRILEGYVPAELIERPKMGFGVPIGDWLRGALRPWAEDLLSARRLARDGLLDAAVVRHAWESHLEGSSLYQYGLWNALTLNAWLDAERAVPTGADEARPAALSGSAS